MFTEPTANDLVAGVSFLESRAARLRAGHRFGNRPKDELDPPVLPASLDSVVGCERLELSESERFQSLRRYPALDQIVNSSSCPGFAETLIEHIGANRIGLKG